MIVIGQQENVMPILDYLRSQMMRNGEISRHVDEEVTGGGTFLNGHMRDGHKRH
jgi:hypothetical protein